MSSGRSGVTVTNGCSLQRAWLRAGEVARPFASSTGSSSASLEAGVLFLGRRLVLARPVSKETACNLGLAELSTCLDVRSVSIPISAILKASPFSAWLQRCRMLLVRGEATFMDEE
ncbi:hypothetical protein ZWY2020_040197, partial [Hordeum vulgare]